MQNLWVFWYKQAVTKDSRQVRVKTYRCLYMKLKGSEYILKAKEGIKHIKVAILWSFLCFRKRKIYKHSCKLFVWWSNLREADKWQDHLGVQFSHSVVSDSLRPHESQHARPPCPSLTPGVHSDSRPSSQWCHPAISSSVVPFSSCPQSLPASESFPMTQLFTWGGQSTGVSA